MIRLEKVVCLKLKVFFSVTVIIEKTDCAFFCIEGKSFSEHFKIVNMIVDGILLAQKNRIISPNYSFGSKFV